MINSGQYVVESNLSKAWAKAFLLSMKRRDVSPLVVTVTGFANGQPFEDSRIRKALDSALRSHDCHECNTVANTIFPSFWRPGMQRAELFQRYLEILPRLRKHPANRHGIYFERMISYDAAGLNQLEHVVETWTRGNHRRSALFVAIVDPLRDHSHQRRRGFPCLLHASFAFDGPGGLSITGFYATQYIFERAYGNYLGLCRLGRFMANALGLELRRMTCVTTLAQRGDMPKNSLAKLVAIANAVLQGSEREE